MKKNNWSLALLVGLISATVALLFAPKSGKELRQDLKEKTNETKDSVKTGTQNLKNDFKESYFEAEQEVEIELAHLDKRQRELRETISSIEKELKH